MRGKRISVVLTGVVAAALAAVAPAPDARAASSCGAAVIADWRDGHFDRTYAPRCYRDAISALPEDIRIYSSAEQDINRALIASLAKRSTTTPKKVGAVKGIVRRLASAQPQAATQRQAAQAALDAGSTSLPVPVVVAAGAALLLVGTAVVSVLARRLRRRLF